MNINDQVCEALGDSLKFALWNEQFSDLTFNCRDGPIRCHQVILGANSTILKKLFLEELQNEDDIHIVLPDFCIKDILILLSILYCGQINLVKSELNNLIELTKLLKLNNFFAAVSEQSWSERFTGSAQWLERFVPKNTKEKTFHVTSNLHTLESVDERVWSCQQCQKIFASQTNLNRHIQKVHAKKTQVSSMSYVCNADQNPCDSLTFTKIQAFTRHMIKEHGVPPWKCEICGKRFKEHQNHQFHALAHSGERAFKCDLCPKSFTSPKTLYGHKELHKGKKFLCPHCGFKARSSPNLYGHIRTKHRERKLRCHLCNRAFATSNNLNHHMRVHTGETPYSCEICDVHFKRVHHLKAHIECRTHLDAIDKRIARGEIIPDHLDPAKRKPTASMRVPVILDRSKSPHKVQTASENLSDESEGMIIISTEATTDDSDNMFVVDTSDTVIEVLDMDRESNEIAAQEVP